MTRPLKLGSIGPGVPANYIEDVFSTWLYTGTGSAQTITNNIDLSTKGGMVWGKTRTTPGFSPDNMLFDTLRGPTYPLYSNDTAAPGQYGSTVTAFNANGFTVGANLSQSGVSHASWSFRKQEKFFDFVTWTGDGNSSRTLNHSLGSIPGCIIVKNTSAASDWCVSHRSLASSDSYLKLNTTATEGTGFTPFPNSSQGGWPTATQFTVRNPSINPMNTSGATYVAYIFAHNAGGFGQTGNDNVISCGSVTTDGSGYGVVNVGFEPQWVLFKGTNSTENWIIVDNMRGVFGTGTDYNAKRLNANTSGAEGTFNTLQLSSTGFKLFMSPTTTYAYIAIRRPMKVPTDATKVFYPLAQTGNADNTSVGFSPDWTPVKIKNGVGNWLGYDRLRGLNQNLQFNTTAAESTVSTIIDGWLMNGVDFGSGVGGTDQVYVPCFKRAPGFFDEVCYIGTGANTTVTHNLGAVPELMIVKSRSVGGVNYDWPVYAAPLTAANALYLNTFDGYGALGSPFWNSTAPTSTVFSLGTNIHVNGSGTTYAAYLFASCPGVSKVGSYTGTAAAQTINCGFAAGARFVLIKRTDANGDWYVWDTARGIVSGNDPYLLLNSTAAEVTTTDYIAPQSSGFGLTASAPAALNASGGSYIFLAIA